MGLTYEQKRIEFNRPSFKDELKNKLGEVCCNCGSCDRVQYHHIVPLYLGGTNAIGNIVPLCHSCHYNAHGAVNVQRMGSMENAGRPKKLPVPNYLEILEEYKTGKIGRKECEQKLNLSGGNKLSDKWYYKKYLRDNHIKVIKNRVDMLSIPKCQKVDHSAEPIARVIYDDGREEKFYRECG